ncbi:MAG: GDP-mannose 4,6-dehydratase [Thermoguttaceae bacterium]
MKLRAVIAGATGLIGSNLAAHLVSKGWEVHGIARVLRQQRALLTLRQQRTGQRERQTC